MNLRPAVLAAACVLSACLDASPTMEPAIDPTNGPAMPPPDDPELYLIGDCPTCCPKWGCGTNGAWLGGNLVFHELDASGQLANSAGLRVGAFRDADAQYNALELGVVDDILFGRCTMTGASCPNPGHLLTGYALIGAQLDLLEPPDATIHVLTIRGYTTIPFWAGDTSVGVPVYKFTYDTDSEREVSLCRPSADPSEPGQGMALIFRGDRYNEETKRVKVTAGNDTWFNVACAGTTVAKMHLLRHTSAGSVGLGNQPPSSQDERQALLKMLVADYCGSGKAFTVDGHPLMYASQQSWGVPNVPWKPGDYWTNVKSVDALWGPRGATCLDTPRLQEDYYPSYPAIPGIKDAIISECGMTNPNLQPCDPGLLSQLQAPPPGAPPTWPGYAISANPINLPIVTAP